MKTLVRDPAAWARRVTPQPVVRTGRGLYRGFASLTAPLRLEPDFILIGAQRCGTTSLFRALAAHPQVVPPTVRKGVNYFDLNYHRGPRWYRRHFPLAEVARRRAARDGGAVTFEASGYYMYHPFALERAAHDLPHVKLVAMLRDPVERAFSAHKHEYARGFEHEDFQQALALEDERLVGEIERMRDDPVYESFEHRHHSYRRRGQYAEQLTRALAHFPAGQLHVMDSETFFEQPEQEYRRLLEFLGLRPFLPSFGRFNARPSEPMDPVVHKQLTEHFRPHDERLASLLGRPPRWAR
jgi:hypothetical protein